MISDAFLPHSQLLAGLTSCANLSCWVTFSLAHPNCPSILRPRRKSCPQSLNMYQELRQLGPPWKHYRWYYSTAKPNREIAPKEGVFEFWKGYFHLKSADTYNHPHPIQDLTTEELAILRPYYMIPLELGIHDTVAQDMTEEGIKKMHEKSSRRFSNAELDIYVNEFGRMSTGFQGGLSWCRVTMNLDLQREVDIFAGLED